MNKFLRYSLLLVLAFVASVTFAQEVTFDFDNDYKTLFPELTGTSSSTSKDGDITKTMTCTTNGISVAVSAKTSGSNENRIWSSSPRLRMYSGTLTIQAPADKKIASIDIINKKWNDNNNAGIPYLSASKETNGENLKITESNEAAEPVIATVKDILDGKYTNDLIKIKEFTFSKEEYTTGKFNYYANDGENKIMIYDKFSGIGGVSKLTEGEKYTLTGIFGVIFKNIPEVLPIKAVEKFEPTGITNITTDEAAKNAPVYNLAGQKVTKAYKGVVIKNGKKMIQK